MCYVGKSESISHSVVSNSATPWTVACQAFCPWNSPGKNTWVGCHFLLQGIFLTQGSNQGFLHGRQILYHLSQQGSSIYYVEKSKWSLSVVSNSLRPHGMYVACQAPPSMGFSRQEYCSGLPFPSPGDLPHPGIKPRSPTLQANSLLSELPGATCYVKYM